jgi:cytochrome c-type biogenesis protein CcmH
MSQQDIEGMVKRLEDKLKAEPNNPEGWQMLARSYANLQRLPEATQAYAKALSLSPDDPLLMIDYADLLAYQNQSVMGEPMRLIEKALVLLPDNLKVLALAGTAYFETKDYAKAEKLWGRARALAPPESEFAKSMAENIEAAREAAAKKK